MEDRTFTVDHLLGGRPSRIKAPSPEEAAIRYADRYWRRRSRVGVVVDGEWFAVERMGNRVVAKNLGPV